MYFGILFGLALAFIAYQYFKGKNTGGGSTTTFDGGGKSMQPK